MTTDSINAPINVIEDFRTLQINMLDDKSGERTAKLARYFAEAADKSQQMRLQSSDFEQKEFAGQMHDAFVAARHIVQTFWEKAHATQLPA
jgi:hypothetical protein